MAAAADDETRRVLVTSTRQLVLPSNPSYLQEFDLRTKQHAVTCATGEYEEGRWRGVPIESLLSRVDADERSTHLLVTGEDGYRTCVAIRKAFDAMLAVAREDVETDGALPRFIGDKIDGQQSVARVKQIETVRLDPEEDASEYAHRPASEG
ncbi:molybdopterin-dependent oxidoreductase [Natronoarchaeum sp. GCM10025703]|uniref:molybdopterin-dependent oxidoreductase n=1 Tax=unclassified Natronoarchaeum TaxID=2620183 RepID=UPI003611CCAC